MYHHGSMTCENNYRRRRFISMPHPQLVWSPENLCHVDLIDFDTQHAKLALRTKARPWLQPELGDVRPGTCAKHLIKHDINDYQWLSMWPIVANWYVPNIAKRATVQTHNQQIRTIRHQSHLDLPVALKLESQIDRCFLLVEPMRSSN
jgi:hypothetical protein